MAQKGYMSSETSRCARNIIRRFKREICRTFAKKCHDVKHYTHKEDSLTALIARKYFSSIFYITPIFNTAFPGFGSPRIVFLLLKQPVFLNEIRITYSDRMKMTGGRITYRRGPLKGCFMRQLLFYAPLIQCIFFVIAH